MKHSHLKIRKLFRSALGFTLVELMVVIALLAIIAGVAIPSFSSLRNQRSESEVEQMGKSVVSQIEDLSSAYSEALRKGETPRYAGFNISTAKSIQDCLRAANNNPSVYDVEVVTYIGESGKPNASLYNYIDTVVVQIVFFGKNDVRIERSINVSSNSMTIPCSPEQSNQVVAPVRFEVMGVWYIHSKSGRVNQINNEEE